LSFRPARNKPLIMNTYKLALVVFFFFIALLPPQSRASEGFFAYTYTAETTPAGQWEYEQKQRWREGKARGSYSAIDLRNEFEYGITDRLQGAFYLNSSYLHSHKLYDPEDVSKPDLPDHDEFNINGVSVELMYRLLSPYKDGVGLAFYIEPEISVRSSMEGVDKIERAVEGRLILQKNFLDDTVVTAFNLMAEPEWEKEDGLTKKELWVQLSAGINYRFAPKWFAGLELRNHMEYIDMNFGNQEHTAYFAGPVLHYGAESYWATLTVLPQLFGWPHNLGTGSDGEPVRDPNLHLGQHEKFEVAIMFGIPLGDAAAHDHKQ
jgi:hypothetical protein